MNKEQVMYQFYKSFAEAYDESSVPDSAGFPRITYEGISDSFGASVATTISIWTRSTSWAQAEAIKRQIEATITRGGLMLSHDEGAIWIKKANPFAQRLGDENDDLIRRIIINLEYEFIN